MTAASSILDLDLPSFDFSDPKVMSNPHAEARRLGKEHWAARFGTGIALLNWDDAVAVSRDKRFGTPVGFGLPSVGVSEGYAYEWAIRTLLGADDTRHTRLRRIAQYAFAPRRLEDLRPGVREMFKGLLEPSVAEGRVEAADLCQRFSVSVAAQVLGWPVEGNQDRFLQWAQSGVELNSLSFDLEVGLPRIEQDLRDMREFSSKQLEKTLASDGGPLANALANSTDKGDKFTVDELLTVLEILLVAGSDTVSSALKLGLLLFAEHPDQWKALVEDQTLVGSAVDEVLRLRPPTMATARVSFEDVELRGVTIPAGTLIFPSQPPANTDEAVFDAPEEFDLTRYRNGSRTPKSAHLSFGSGAHMCLGHYLARIELQEALLELVEQAPTLRIDASDTKGVEWVSNPLSVHSPSRLPLAWDVVAS